MSVLHLLLFTKGVCFKCGVKAWKIHLWVRVWLGLELVINLHLLVVSADLWHFNISFSRGENRSIFPQLQIPAQVNPIPSSSPCICSPDLISTCPVPFAATLHNRRGCIAALGMRRSFCVGDALVCGLFPLPLVSLCKAL